MSTFLSASTVFKWEHFLLTQLNEWERLSFAQVLRHVLHLSGNSFAIFPKNMICYLYTLYSVKREGYSSYGKIYVIEGS